MANGSIQHEFQTYFVLLSFEIHVMAYYIRTSNTLLFYWSNIIWAREYKNVRLSLHMSMNMSCMWDCVCACDFDSYAEMWFLAIAIII